MNKQKIGYFEKQTNSRNTYIDISKRDEDMFYKNLLAINSYMSELALSKDEDVNIFIKWYRSPDKRYPYNTRLGRRNTPETMIAGLINNVFFGNQRDISTQQLPYLEEIVNTCAEVINELKIIKKLELQSNTEIHGIQFGLAFG